MPASRIAQLHRSIRTAREMTLGIVEDIPAEQWVFQPFPGINHVAWNLLHLMLAEDWGPTALGDPVRLWADRYHDLMKRGPLADAGAYPPRDAILEALDSTHRRFLAALERIEESDLERKTSGPISRYAPDLGTVLDSHVWHEGFHGGQLSVIRKALGLAPKFG